MRGANATVPTINMKVLFDHPWPFMLAHGGFQIQIEQTKAALEAVNVEVEFLRWWDDRQSGDLIHYFGRPPSGYINFAHQKGLKVVLAELLTGLGSRPVLARQLQKSAVRTAQKLLPGAASGRMGWANYRLADACIANTALEAQFMVEIFSAPRERVHCVPNGVEEVFFDRQNLARGQWLVCTATITKRKRIVELAEAAALARVPLWIIGRPYADSDSVAQKFRRLVTEHPEWLRYDGPVGDRRELAKIYQQARGFVLLSSMETRSLSAEEAAASGCPLLLSDLGWARSVFGETARYCPVTSVRRTAPILKRFYAEAPSISPPPPPGRWRDVGEQLRQIYQILIKTPL